jgi:hypothetical protein
VDSFSQSHPVNILLILWGCYQQSGATKISFSNCGDKFSPWITLENFGYNALSDVNILKYLDYFSYRFSCPPGIDHYCGGTWYWDLTVFNAALRPTTPNTIYRKYFLEGVPF